MVGYRCETGPSKTVREIGVRKENQKGTGPRKGGLPGELEVHVRRKTPKGMYHVVAHKKLQKGKDVRLLTTSAPRENVEKQWSRLGGTANP